MYRALDKMLIFTICHELCRISVPVQILFSGNQNVIQQIKKSLAEWKI